MAAVSVFDAFAKPPCADTLGWELIEADEEHGRITAAFVGRPEFCNPRGNIQGGFLAAMLDDTLGPAVLVRTGGAQSCATIDLSVSFLAPAAPGRLIGSGRVVKLGKTIAFLEGELRAAGGEIVARATACARLIAARS